MNRFRQFFPRALPRHAYTSLAILASLALSACGLLDNKHHDPKATLQLGPSVSVVDQTVSSGGGTVTFTKPGDSLSGLSIEVPSGAYSVSTSFSVSYEPIQGQTFGENFHPISPLIKISNGGGYSNKMMQLRIPCKIPKGYFAMAFAYDEATGKLEAIPQAGYDSTGVTAFTRHFAHSGSASIRSSGALAKSAAGLTPAQCKLLILALSKKVLLEATVSTPFTPGVDDFQFPNRGSTVAVGGHCMGQSLAMIYYYINQRENDGPQLHGRYDNTGQTFATPNIWKDDKAAYKFCSVLQRDGRPDLKEDSASMDRNILITSDLRDSMTLFSFKLALVETEEPQLLLITDIGRGHAILVYGASGTTLFICDPNDPGHQHSSTWSNGGFDPYLLGGVLPFRYLFFGGQSSLFNWTKTHQRWQEFQSGTIGDGLFPALTLKVQDSTETAVPLTNSFVSKTGTPRFSLSTGDTGRYHIDSVFLEDGSHVAASGGRWYLPLGQRDIGFYIEDDSVSWTDFQWFNINSVKEVRAPHVSSGTGSGIMPLAIDNEWHWDEIDYDSKGAATGPYDGGSIRIISLYTQGSKDSNNWEYSPTVFGRLPFQDYNIALYGGFFLKETNGLYWGKDNISPGGITQIAQYPTAVGNTFGKVRWGGDTTTNMVVEKINTSTAVGTNVFPCTIFSTQYRVSDGAPLTDAQVNASISVNAVVFTRSYYAPGIGPVKYEEYKLTAGRVRYLSRVMQINWYTIH